MKTTDFESPDDLMRIQLVIDISHAQHGANAMSKSLKIVRKFEKDMEYWYTIPGILKKMRHRRMLKRMGI